MLNRKLLLIICCGLLLAGLIPGVTAQEGGCTVDFARLQALMTQSENAMAAGNLSGALAALNQIGVLIEGIDAACGGELNWCDAGQPWGDGRCNADGLTDAQVDWFWTCGWHWAQFTRGNIDTVPGFCGGDRDGDGIPDDDDACPDQGGSVDANGCPLSVPLGPCEVDGDGDGTADCYDQCPADPGKTAPGVCGCGQPDEDTNGDGMADCTDLCPADPAKITPGVCGCGTPDTDTDGDGAPDCNDGCPTDPGKTAPGACGCGSPEGDIDGDGVPNCVDGCPADFFKITPGACGCGVAETTGDLDGDGVIDCNDSCPMDYRPVGSLCWDVPPAECFVLTGIAINPGSGCVTTRNYAVATGCTLSTPACP